MFIDNLSLWDIALSPSMIENYIICPPNGNEIGLVGFWNFEEGEGTIINDLSVYENHSFLSEMTFSVNIPEQNCQLKTVNGCDSTAILDLLIYEQISSENIVYDATSLSECNGFIISIPEGGNPPYNFNWNGTDGLYITEACDGNNILTLTDSTGCKLVDTIFVGPMSYGCTDQSACNFNEISNFDDGSCIYADSIYDCFANCLNDIDFDGVCDEYEIMGCTNVNSPNYDSLATDDDGSCIICDLQYEYNIYNTSNISECNGLIALIVESDFSHAYINDEEFSFDFFTNNVCYGQNIVTIFEDNNCSYVDTILINSTLIYGCKDTVALNYNVDANTDDGSCIYNSLELDIEVIQEPFCAGSFSGGQLHVNVEGGSGDYTYEWLNASGSYIPGGPQTNPTTFSFIPVNLECWVYVTDQNQNCVDSASYIFTEYSCQEDTASLTISEEFHINPVGYNEYSECDLTLENLGCQLNFKSEFIISHQMEDIEQGDFIIEFYNSQSTWESISYTIDDNGDAIGFWYGDIGETINCDYTMQRTVRLKFNQMASNGEYSILYRIWGLDENYNLTEVISNELSNILILNSSIEGCTDPNACNYDENTSIDDGSCTYINNSIMNLIENQWVQLWNSDCGASRTCLLY